LLACLSACCCCWKPVGTWPTNKHRDKRVHTHTHGYYCSFLHPQDQLLESLSLSLSLSLCSLVDITVVVTVIWEGPIAHIHTYIHTQRRHALLILQLLQLKKKKKKLPHPIHQSPMTGLALNVVL
jgi:hypothetical protein